MLGFSFQKVNRVCYPFVSLCSHGCVCLIGTNEHKTYSALFVMPVKYVKWRKLIFLRGIRQSKAKCNNQTTFLPSQIFRSRTVKKLIQRLSAAVNFSNGKKRINLYFLLRQPSSHFRLGYPSVCNLFSLSLPLHIHTRAPARTHTHTSIHTNTNFFY